METICFRCPPIVFNSHFMCHTQNDEYLILWSKIQDEKENIQPTLLSKLLHWDNTLFTLFTSCITDQQFLQYGMEVKTFNTVLRLITDGTFFSLPDR